jgi:hypothetical protein
LVSEGSTGSILTPEAAAAPADVLGLRVDETAAQRELLEERLAIVEADAGPPPADAYPLFLPLCTREPFPAEEGVFGVDDLCEGCWEVGKISHLYTIRDGVRRCRKCRR